MKRNRITPLIIALALTGSLYLHVYAAPPASAPTSQPALDRLLDELARVDPKALAERLGRLQAQMAQLKQENASIKAKLAANEQSVNRLTTQLNLLEALIKARAATTMLGGNLVATTRPSVQKAVTMASAAKPPPPAAPKGSEPLINYTDHILPIINERCAGCHNPDKARGGLVLVTYNDAMSGGGSGKVIVPGSADQSRLYKLVSHQETPYMPPMQSKLEDARLELIRKWIDAGAPIDRNAKPLARKDAAMAPAAKAVAIDTDTAPMPDGLTKGPVNKPPHPLPANAIAISPVGQLLAIGGSEQILYYHAKTRELLGVLPFPEGRIEHLRFSRDGTWLIAAGGQTGQSGTVVAFDVETGKRVGQFDKQYDAVLAAAVSPDNALVAVGGTNSKVRVYDANTAAKSYELLGHNDWIQAIEFSPDGLLLATADRAGGLHVWDAENGREIHNLPGHTAGITALSFRGDSQVLASTGKDGTVRLWHMESGKQIRQWTAHSPASLCVEFAPDNRIATCGADGLTRLWDQSGRKLREFANQGDWVYRVAFTPDAAELAAGTYTGAVAMFETATGKLLATLGPSR